MKSEWEFQFQARGFKFEREHKYKVQPNTKVAFGDRPLETVEPFVRIVPKDVEPPSYVDQVGSLHVLLPHSYIETRDFAIFIAKVVADRITFQQGDFRILGGLVACKRIAETPEEEEEFGEALYHIETHLIEVLPTPAFEPLRLGATPKHPRHVELIAQFNEAKRDDNPVRQFLSYFKIVESATHRKSETGSMKQILARNAVLKRLHADGITGGTFEELVSKLVDVRHKCAHLKLDRSFGYSPGDRAIKLEVSPLLSVVAILAYNLIMGGNSSDA